MSTHMKQIDDRAELARLGAWASGSMTAAESEQVEAELRADAEFFGRMAPMLEISLAREPVPAIEAEMDAMRAEAAEIRERKRERARTRRHIVAAVGSLFTLKSLMGGLAVATTAVVVAVMVPKERRVDDTLMPRRQVAVKPPPATPPPITTPGRTGTPAVKRVPRVPRHTEVAFSLPPVDRQAQRAVDSIMKAQAPLSASAVSTPVITFAAPLAAERPPVKRLVWAESPADTITGSKPGPVVEALRGAGKVAVEVIKFPFWAVKHVFGGSKPPDPTVPHFSLTGGRDR
jgi:hypothetical protein